MNLIAFILAGLITCFGLIIAFLPEIIATIAGEKKSRRLIGMMMIAHRRNKVPFDTFKIRWYNGMGWVFLAVCAMDFITSSPMIVFSALMSIVFFRISENWSLTNEVIKKLMVPLP